MKKFLMSEVPLYGIAYRRVYGFSTSGLFNNPLSCPLCRISVSLTFTEGIANEPFLFAGDQKRCLNLSVKVFSFRLES